MQYLAIGGIAGILSGLFGIGGGVVIVPALLLIARMKPETAASEVPVGALGAYRYYRSGFLDLPVALKLAAGLFVGAWVGAHLALKLSPRDLQRAFAAFLVVVAGHLWMSAS